MELMFFINTAKSIGKNYFYLSINKVLDVSSHVKNDISNVTIRALSGILRLFIRRT